MEQLDSTSKGLATHSWCVAVAFDGMPNASSDSTHSESTAAVIQNAVWTTRLRYDTQDDVHWGRRNPRECVCIKQIELTMALADTARHPSLIKCIYSELSTRNSRDALKTRHHIINTSPCAQHKPKSQQRKRKKAAQPISALY
jgi:hypothetical protein